MPSDFPLVLYRGDTHRWTFRLWADAAKTSPIDLATATVKAEIRNSASGLLITPIDCTVTLPNTIAALLSATASSATMPPARWDLQLTWASGDVQTPIGGAVSVQSDVTP